MPSNSSIKKFTRQSYVFNNQRKNQCAICHKECTKSELRRIGNRRQFALNKLFSIVCHSELDCVCAECDLIQIPDLMQHVIIQYLSPAYVFPDRLRIACFSIVNAIRRPINFSRNIHNVADDQKFLTDTGIFRQQFNQFILNLHTSMEMHNLDVMSTLQILSTRVNRKVNNFDMDQLKHDDIIVYLPDDHPGFDDIHNNKIIQRLQKIFRIFFMKCYHNMTFQKLGTESGLSECTVRRFFHTGLILSHFWWTKGFLGFDHLTIPEVQEKIEKTNPLLHWLNSCIHRPMLFIVDGAEQSCVSSVISNIRHLTFSGKSKKHCRKSMYFVWYD